MKKETIIPVIALVVIAAFIMLKRDLDLASTSTVSWTGTVVGQTRKNNESSCIAGMPPASNIDVLNNQTYTWYGNQWISPSGIPVYTREEMREVFSQFDTLWIGDSTTRRAFATIFALMNSTSSLISVDALNSARVIDVNKYAYAGRVDEYSCINERNISKSYYYNQSDMYDMWTNSSVCRRLAGRSFDFVKALCLKEISEIGPLYWDLKRYSLIIIGVGIHDALKPRGCLINVTEMDPNATINANDFVGNLERKADSAWQGVLQMAKTIKEAHDNDQAPTAVIWRTTGFDSKSDGGTTDRVLHLNRMALDFVQNKSVLMSSNGTIGLVDWGAAIFPRSFSTEKIPGDLGAHYGLEARSLMAQMTTQQLQNILVRFKVNHHKEY